MSIIEPILPNKSISTNAEQATPWKSIGALTAAIVAEHSKPAGGGK